MMTVLLKHDQFSLTDVNGVKKSPKKTQRPRKALSTAKQSEPKSRLVEMGTQTSPGLALNSRGRTKKST